MEKHGWQKQVQVGDNRRHYVNGGTLKETVIYSAHQFIQIGQKALREKGKFYVALSGGSTPHAIYQTLSQLPFRDLLNWEQVYFFWSDERSVPPDNKESNYFNAMEAGLSFLPIPKENLFRMEGEKEIEQNASKYELLIKKLVPFHQFDLLMLGMGEDGHVASLFPYTKALQADNCLVAANYIPQLHTWRLTLTYPCIQAARQICLYVTGKKKEEAVARVLKGPYNPLLLPAQKIGTVSNPALWILDQEAANLISFNH